MAKPANDMQFRKVVRAARLAAEGKVCYACGRKLPKPKKVAAPTTGDPK